MLFSVMDSTAVAPATIGAVTRILTNREQDSGRREAEEIFFFTYRMGYVFLSAGELCTTCSMGRSAASKLRRKSQREASDYLRDQSDATLATGRTRSFS